MDNTSHAHLIDAALRLDAAGIVALPVRTDGSKAPALSTWRKYQEQRPTLDELLAWFGGDSTDGIGVLTGLVSGALEMVELEGRAVESGALEQLRTWAADNGAAELLERVSQGYTEITPSGGIHILYRVAGSPRRNTKLARNPERQVLAETRGEGGFVVVAPSAGRSHPSGMAWAMQSGSIETIATISEEEREMLWALLRLLDEDTEREQPGQQVGGILGSMAGLRPGDDFAERMTWDDILAPHGWTKAFRMGSGYSWRKPDKNGIGISATTGQSSDGVDRLYVFSTSTVFESERPYNKFSAYALLEHGGDYSAAASALAAKGFGKAPQQSTVVSTHAAREYQASSVLVESDGSISVGLLDAGAGLSLEDLAFSPATTLAQSEDGHSQALISEHGSEIRYCHEMGRWLNWDGHRWEVQPAGGGIVREYAKRIARSYPDDAEWRNHKKRCLSSIGINGALGMSATDFRVEVSVGELDAHAWELNTPAGIVDLRSGALKPSDPTRLHTKATAFAPDFGADQRPWTDFLTTTFQGDAEMIAYIKRLMGYACVGAVREAILPVFYGQGANGKTVLLEAVQAVLGDYATVAPQKFLVQGPSQHATEIAAIAGARLVIASETNEGEKFDEARVKLLTGGDKIKARFMRQDEFTFIPSHLLVMMTNHRPEVGAGGTSFWRRVREIPFLHTMPEELRDPELKDRLVEQHGPAIMAWLAVGAAEYARSGLGEPDKVKAATSTYEKSTDTVARFVEEMCIIGGGEMVKCQSAAVRDSYEIWCRSEGEQPVSAKAFSTQMTARFGIGKSRDKRSRYFTNVSLVGGGDDD